MSYVASAASTGQGATLNIDNAYTGANPTVTPTYILLSEQIGQFEIAAKPRFAPTTNQQSTAQEQLALLKGYSPIQAEFNLIEKDPGQKFLRTAAWASPVRRVRLQMVYPIAPGNTVAETHTFFAWPEVGQSRPVDNVQTLKATLTITGDITVVEAT